MQRFISISMVAVLAGWLALPAAGAHFAPCDMKCCHREAAPDCGDMPGMEVSGMVQNAPEIHAGTSTALGKCCVRGRRIQFGLFTSDLGSVLFNLENSAPVLSIRKPQIALESGYSGRAPPRTV